jgi:hypothetical protein
MRSIVTTGDVVLDCHLYGGVKTAATSFSEPGTIYTEHLGGAALTHELLQAVAETKGTLWDEKNKKWEKENTTRQKSGKALLPRPDDLDEQRPSASYETHLNLDVTQPKLALPKHLRSYGVWTAQPEKKGAKGRVWRIKPEDHFGYGPTEPPKASGLFQRQTSQPQNQPALILIDDGAIQFRHDTSTSVWPELFNQSTAYYLLKMSWPLCRGDLWTKLSHVMHRLIVVISAIDLRRHDAQINSRLSWEQCTEHTVRALKNDPIARDLLRAAHVIVSYRSAGALWIEKGLEAQSFTSHLFFDPTMLEGDYSLNFNGTCYGFQTCSTVGVAHHLMQRDADADGKQKLSPFVDRQSFNKAMSDGIMAGLLGRRHLLELGHGRVEAEHPGFPMASLGQNIACSSGGFVLVDVPPDAGKPGVCQWTILSQSETAAHLPATTTSPLTGLAQLTARYGFGALSHVPSLRLGNLFTVDRSEIESFRTIDALIRAYEAVKIQKKPLSLGVFGPPGAGKSFGVKALAKAILGEKVPFLEFNLSQFKGPDELIGAFHKVRDAVLGGITPVTFWDEFDSQTYKWLQYLLAPMQDGSFQEGQITHPIGKCVFIFAGGTSSTYAEFGVPVPAEPTKQELAELSKEERTERLQEFREKIELHRQFKLIKGPDFTSRLHGFLNVLGPNPRSETNCVDITWPIRRAIILRGIVGLKDYDELDIDNGLLNALLCVSKYRHGARSFEKIILTLMNALDHGRLQRSALPPQSLLQLETDAEEFRELLTRGDDFKNYPDLEALAAAVHYSYLKGADKSKVDAAVMAEPNIAYMIHLSIKRDYEENSADKKASNRAAAQRIPDHLALIGYVVEPQQPHDDGSWRQPLVAAIENHVERLAQAEHLGWCAERVANGWTYDKVRDDNAKRHPLLTPWAKLSPSDQNKDRSIVRGIPDLLETAKFKALPVQSVP